jgi:hypothetical protein
MKTFHLLNPMRKFPKFSSFNSPVKSSYARSEQAHRFAQPSHSQWVSGSGTCVGIAGEGFNNYLSLSVVVLLTLLSPESWHVSFASVSPQLF